ncbi:MAG: hypothetical protein AAGA23_16940 [Pseudomonadota bacterium]
MPTAVRTRDWMRQTHARHPWWRGAWLPICGLAALLLLGGFYLAPHIEARVLAPSAVLVLCAIGLGASLGYWWCRRQFIDVSESYHALLTAREEEEDLWTRMFDRLDEVDSAIEPKVRTALADLPEPEPVDLTSMERSLAELRALIAALHIPERDDLNAVEESLQQLDENVAAITFPESPADLAAEPDPAGSPNAGEGLPKNLPEPDLAPLMNSLGDLSDEAAEVIPGKT